MASNKRKVSKDLIIDPTVQSILVNPSEVMPGFSSEPVIKFELVRNW